MRCTRAGLCADPAPPVPYRVKSNPDRCLSMYIRPKPPLPLASFRVLSGPDCRLQSGPIRNARPVRGHRGIPCRPRSQRPDAVIFLEAEMVAGGLGDSPSQRPQGALAQRGVGEDQRCEEPRAV